MGTKHLNIPHDLSSVNLTKGTDDIDITVTATCNWCFSDPDYVFGNPSTLLAPGLYTVTTPHTKYGPYTPQNDGTVNFGASIPPAACNPDGIQGTPHTITVTGGNMPGSKK
jgi:hypothetical protein